MSRGPEHPGGSGGGEPAPRLALVVRGPEGAEERRLLDIADMTSDPEALDRAAAAARDGRPLLVEGAGIPVFDLRTGTSDAAGAGDAGRGSAAAASGGCLLVGERGGVRVALLID